MIKTTDYPVFPEPPILKPTDDNRFVLADTYRVENVKVPRGYKTNGANIPRLFWWLIPPFKPKYLPAIIIHDYLCDREKYPLADSLFEYALLQIEDSFITRLMIKAVKIYHKIKYGV